MDCEKNVRLSERDCQRKKEKDRNKEKDCQINLMEREYKKGKS